MLKIGMGFGVVLLVSILVAPTVGQSAKDWFDKGNSLYDQGKYDEAIKVLDKAIGYDSNDAEAWNKKGEALYYQGKYDEAIRAYDEAIKIYPNFALAWENKGDAFRDLGSYNKSIDAYEKAIELDPELATYLGVRLHFPILKKLGEINEAEAAFAKEGYELAIQSVDIDGNKAYLELIRHGTVVDSKVIVAHNKVDDTYIYSKPGASQSIKAQFKNVFRGADQNLATIDCLWQWSEEDPSRLLVNDSYLTVISGTPLKLEEGYELAIKSVDIDGNKAYLELSKDGSVVDSKVIVAANEVDDTYVYSNTKTSQAIRVHFKNAFRGSDQHLATIDSVLQTSESDASRIPINSAQTFTVTSGTPLKLDEGYELAIKSVDIDGNKVYLELIKDGYSVDSKIILASNEVDDIYDDTYVYSSPGASQSIKVHFKNAFRGADQNLATIDSISQTSEIDSSRILINNANESTIRSGETLKLNEGYELAIKSVDIDGNKAYLELIKDGSVVDSKIIVAANEVDDTYVYSNTKTSQAIRVHFKNAFRGSDQHLATIDRFLQTSESDPSRILINNTQMFTVTSGKPLKLDEGYELAIKSVDIDGNKAYLELIKDGSVVDSKIIVAANEVDDTYVYSNPKTSQAIKVHFKNAFRGWDKILVTIDSISQTSEIDSSRILINNANESTIRSGETLKLDEGYELAIKSVDIDGNKAYLELSKDGSVVDSKVIVAANEVDDTYVYSNTETLQAIRVHFKNAFRGADQNLVTVDSVSETFDDSSS